MTIKNTKKNNHYSPPLKTWDILKEANNAWDRSIIQAIEVGKPVVMATGMMPRQLTHAFDCVYVVGEWYGSICGFHRANDLAETAESCGFPHELCSYARMTIGSMIADRGFLGKFPTPKAVIGTEGYCNVQTKWFEAIARYYNVPFFVIDGPLIQRYNEKNWGEEAAKDAVEYIYRQLGNCLEFLEWSLGLKINEEKLIDATNTMHTTELLWDELLRLWRKKPAPITIRNIFTFENLIVSIPCEKEAHVVLNAVIEELNERMEKGIAGIENEEVRLIWHGQPGWYVLNVLNYFQSQGATFVGTPYLELFGHHYRFDSFKDGIPEWFRQWNTPKNIDECLWEIAKGAAAIQIRPRLDATTDMLFEMASDAQADGAVWHAVRGCKGLSFGQLSEMEALRRELGLPGFILEGSPADSRDFSEGPALRQIKVFIEQVKRMKKRKKARGLRASKNKNPESGSNN